MVPGVVAPPRLSGLLLVAGLLIGLLALGVLVVDGALPAFGAALRRGSLKALAPHVLAFRVSNVLYAAAWVSLLLGFVLLTRSLVRSGEDLFSGVALAATVVATVLGLLEASFGIMVTPWAAQEAANSGVVPVAYTALDRWVSAIQAVYIFLGLAAQAGFGASLLRTELLPSWVGQATLVWASAWLMVLGLGIPAILFVMPAVIGLAVLFA